jgi:hypothetical protein
MPLEERFGHAPAGACFKRCLPSEITSFVVDSSRSRELAIGLLAQFVFVLVISRWAFPNKGK